MSQDPVSSPDDPRLGELCRQLADHPPPQSQTLPWLTRQMQICSGHGVFRWFVPRSMGGLEWSEVDLVRGYLALSGACLTTSFVITQWTAAVRRILASDNRPLAEQQIPGLIAGRSFVTVGISHLTTSRQHRGQPALRATAAGSGFRLDGFSPWVSAAALADDLVMGATLEDGRQMLAVVPAGDPGVEVASPLELVALSASLTGPVQVNGVMIADHQVIAGPATNLMASATGARTGGLQTSTLAIGLAGAAARWLQDQAVRRANLEPGATALVSSCDELRAHLLASAGGTGKLGNDELRARANRLVLRATQAALVAAKGTGFVQGHPVGRWCRESLFFLVWSCPQAVQDTNLCELAGGTGEF